MRRSETTVHFRKTSVMVCSSNINFDLAKRITEHIYPWYTCCDGLKVKLRAVVLVLNYVKHLQNVLSKKLSYCRAWRNVLDEEFCVYVCFLTHLVFEFFGRINFSIEILLLLLLLLLSTESSRINLNLRCNFTQSTDLLMYAFYVYIYSILMYILCLRRHSILISFLNNQ